MMILLLTQQLRSRQVCGIRLQRKIFRHWKPRLGLGQKDRELKRNRLLREPKWLAQGALSCVILPIIVIPLYNLFFLNARLGNTQEHRKRVSEKKELSLLRNSEVCLASLLSLASLKVANQEALIIRNRRIEDWMMFLPGGYRDVSAKYWPVTHSCSNAAQSPDGSFMGASLFFTRYSHNGHLRTVE